jgi:hypothetical protein
VHVVHHGAFSNALGRVKRQQSEATGLVTPCCHAKSPRREWSQRYSVVRVAKYHLLGEIYAEAFGVLLLGAAVAKTLLR